MQIHSHLKNRHEWLLVGCKPPPGLKIPLLCLTRDASHLNIPNFHQDPCIIPSDINENV